VYIALICGLLYLWFEYFPVFFIQVYGFTLFTQELAFLRIFIGLMEKEGKARPN
jgi:DHA1 family multidrug resistance protein-like MFS transporter